MTPHQVLTPVQESPSQATVTTLPPPCASTTPSVPQQTTTSIPTLTITTDAPAITTAVFESNALSVVQLRVAKLEKYVSKLKKIDLFAEALAALKTQVLSFVDNYLGYKLPKKQTATVDLEQESEKTPSKILKIKKEQAEKQKIPKFIIKSTDQATLKEYDLKSALYQTMHANKSFNRNLANHQLYHALMEALTEDENTMDKGVADTGKQTKRRRTKDSESSKKPSTTKETSKGKAPSKGSKTSKSVPAKEPVEEPVAKVVMDDAGDDVVHDEDQVQDAFEPKTTKISNPDWTCHNLLKSTCSSSIELEYHFQECLNALTDRLDWNNPEGDRYPFDLSKPFPLQGHTGHLTIAADYFFNNDLEYLKSCNPKRT
ncbi:hypothetical protein Tco_0586227 [Tanacetum coccineum]